MELRPRIAIPRALAGGLAALVVTMGVGRFAYTPLLPVMQREFGFGADLGGALASLNFVGYLLGALLCVFLPVAGRRALLLRGSLVLSVATTALMGLSAAPAVWGGLRLLSGVASAGAMVLGSALVLEALAGHPAAWLRGLIFSGIGLGIALTGLLTLLWEGALSAAGMWLGLAAVCLPLAAISWRWAPGDTPAPPAAGARALPLSRRSRRLLGGLVLAYFCEGLGYIITGTFLVAIVRQTTGAAAAGNLTWVVVGLAAAALTPLWPLAASRFGAVPALVAAHLLQAAGILLPALSGGLAAAIIGATLFGGTFLGVVIMSLNLGRGLAPGRGTAVIGALTAAFGVGQIIGPLAAGGLAARTASFTLALAGAAAVVALGGLALALAARRPRRAAAPSPPIAATAD